MLKRFVARLLIITQIYSCFFQGIVHAATLVDESHYHRHLLEKQDDRDDESIPPTASSSVEDAHISSFTHLYSAINELGELQFALGDGSFKAPRVFTIPTPDNPADILEYGGVTVKAQSTSFRFQGLQVSVNRSGVMVVEGCQTTHHNPIFLASNRPIILNSIEASGLSIAAPRIVHSGISKFTQLKFEGLGTADGDASFINAGQISAKELFLTHLNSVNGGGISATRFAVDGQLASTGSINSSELILEENALLKLTEASRADIKTLFLSKASHLENHATTHTASVGVLDGLGGSITNHGTLAVSDVAADSAFQAITNRHILDIERGDINTQSLENSGTINAAESRLQVESGKNQQALKAKQLLVEAEFANEESGHLAIEAIAGAGHFHNFGTIETDTALALGVKQFATQGHLKAKSLTGLDTLMRFTNLEDGKVEILEALGFAPTIKVINKGELVAQTIALVSDQTVHSGELTARELLTITGIEAFANHGTISCDHLDVATLLLNHKELTTQQSTQLAQGLTNAARATSQLKGLVLSDDTRVINHGKLAIDGVTELGILQITNTGGATAIIDAGNALPSSSAVISAPGAALSVAASSVDPEFYTLSRARENGAKYKSEFSGKDPIQGDPEFYTLSQAREAGIRYKAQAKLALEMKLAQLQKQRSAFPTAISLLAADQKINQIGHLGTLQNRIRSYGREAGIPEHIISTELSVIEHVPTLKTRVAAKYILYKEYPQGYVVEQEIQKVKKELAETRWNFGLTPQERQSREPQLEADRAQLAIETLKVRLQVVNQASGELTLRSGHFDLTGDQALVNDGVLTQEAAQLHLCDPTTWSAPRSFNNGTWQVKGSLALMGNAAKDVGKLLVDGLHVEVPAIGSKVLRGQIETTDFSAGSGIELFGSLVTHRSTQLQGLTIAADAVADLKGLKLTGGEIVNFGKLIVTGAQNSDFEAFEKARAVVGITPGQQLVFDRIALMRANRDISGLTDLHGISEEVSGFMDAIMALQPQERAPILDDLGAKVGMIAPKFGRQNPFMSAQIKGAFDFLIRSTKEDIQTARDISIQQLSTSKQLAYEQFARSFFGNEVIKLTNRGTAIIDAGYNLPKIDEHSPENLAVIHSVSPIYPEILEFKEAQMAMRATPEEMQLVRSQIQKIPLAPVMTSGNSIGKINFLISRALNAIAKLPSQDRGVLLTELRDRINLIAPTYSGYDYIILTTAFNGIRNSFVPKIQAAIDFTFEQTKHLQQLPQLLIYKDLMPEVFQVKGLPAATASLRPFLTRVALAATKDFVEKPEARIYPDIASYNGVAGKIQTSKLKASCEGREYISGIDPAIVSINGVMLKAAASRYKEISENPLIVPEQLLSIPAEVVSAEQQFTLQLQQQVEFLQQLSAFRKPMSEIPQIKLQVSNQASGKLTLKSGRFEFMGDATLVNHGTLIQESAYTLWLTSNPSEFNSGTWRTEGSLGLLSYQGKDVGKLEVEDTLHVNATCDALIALDALAKVKTLRVTLQAPHLQELPETPVRASRTYPWPLEMLLSGDFDSNVDISSPSLKILSRFFRTSGNIASQTPLEITAAEAAEIAAPIGGKEGLNLQAKRLTVLGKAPIAGATSPAILHKRSGNGLYSSEGPVVLQVSERIDNQYGIIQGTSYRITAPELVNTAGLISATDPSLSSEMRVVTIRNNRDERGSTPVYRCFGHPSMNISAKNRYNHNQLMWCGSGCQHVSNNYHETSDQGVIIAKGALLVAYTTLEMLASRISSGGNLTLTTPTLSRTYTNSTPITDAPSTTMPQRDTGHNSQITAKYDFNADLGVVDAAVSVTAQNVSIRALAATFQSLGIQVQQTDQVFDVLSSMRGVSANAYKASKGPGAQHLDLALPIYSQQALPQSVAVFGKGARARAEEMQTINMQATMRAYMHAMGVQFATVYRGISALGMNENHIFKLTSDFVRAQKGTSSHTRLIKSGDQAQEVEVLANEEITETDILKTGLPAVFLQFAENIHLIEAAQKAQAEVERATEVSASLFFGIPSENPDGIKAIDKVALSTSVGDLKVFLSVRAQDGLLIAEQGGVTIGSTVVRQHSGENYQDALIRTAIEMERTLRIQGFKDVSFEAAITRAGIRSDITSETGMVIDRAVTTTSYRVDHYHSKDESTTVRTTHDHQNVCEHSAGVEAVITSHVANIHEGSKLTNARESAPAIIHEAVQDRHMVDIETVRHKKAGGIFGSWFGITERKSTHSSSAASIARGGITAGSQYIANAIERFRAVAPTFAAERSDITAPQIELTTGVSQSQSFTQSTYQGPIWNKSSVSTESHTTHCNPTFEHNVYLHSPSVILERVRGSAGTFDRIISDTPVQFRDVDDQHHSTHQSQKSLSAGATLILSLAVTLATMNPTAAMSTMSIEGAMLSAAYGTLCSQTAICLVEKDGNLGKAIDELGRRDIGKTMLMSAATAGLTKGLGDKLGITGSTAFDNLAKKHLLQSAINTTLSVAIDGQRPEDAIKQGLTSAAINTLAAYAAGKIGGAYFDKDIDPFSHKLLHGVLGAASGATSAMLLKGDIGRGAMSGAFGAVLAETITDAFSPDQADIDSYVAEHPGVEKEAVKTHFMEKTQATANWSVFTSTLGAFGVGLDAGVAHGAARNAVDHNMLRHVIAWLAISTVVSVEWYHFTNDIKAEGIEAALGKLGIRVIEDATIAMAVSSGIAAAPIAFEVGGVVCKTLREAIALVRAHPLITKEVTETCQALEHNMPKLQKMLDGLKVGADKTREYVRDQFNYREFFEAERLRREGGKVAKLKTPGTEDVSTASSSLDSIRLRNQLTAEQISNGHSFEKHIIKQGEFPGWIRTRDQLKYHIENVLADPSTTTFTFKDGRSAYVHRPSSTVIIRDPKAPDGGTIFQPEMSMEKFLLKQGWK